MITVGTGIEQCFGSGSGLDPLFNQDSRSVSGFVFGSEIRDTGWTKISIRDKQLNPQQLLYEFRRNVFVLVP
jgi:hypothetical protein